MMWQFNLLSDRIGNLGTELRAEMAQQGSDLRGEIGDLRTEMQTGFAEITAVLLDHTARLETAAGLPRPTRVVAVDTLSMVSASISKNMKQLENSFDRIVPMSRVSDLSTSLTPRRIPCLKQIALASTIGCVSRPTSLWRSTSCRA